MKTAIYFKAVIVIVLCEILFAPLGAMGLTKTNNNDALNVASSWVENSTPANSATLIWDSTVATPANCTNTAGGTINAKGIRILNPSAAVQINNNQFFLGVDAIDLSQANFDLTLNSGITRSGSAGTNGVPSGRTLTFGGVLAFRPGISDVWKGGGVINVLGSSFDLASGGSVGRTDLLFTNITVVSTALLKLATLGGSTGSVSQVGGSVSLQSSSAFGLSFGDAHNTRGIYDLSAGTLTVSTNVALGSQITTSGGFLTNMNSSLIVRGVGVATITNDIWMGGYECSNGWATVTLMMGGTLSVGSIKLNSLVKNYTSVVEFDGGTLKPMRDTTTFLGGLTQATLSTNGAVIDTAGCSITVSQKLENATGQAGKLTKSGAGRLTLSAANPYTGVTTINNGTLALASAGAISNSALINVASGATCDVSAVTGFAVCSGQSLMGLGVVTGATTIASGGTLAPGGTNGTLLVTGSASATNLVLGGTLSVTGDVSRVSSTPWLSVTGSVDLANSTVTGTNLNLLAKPQSYILLSYSGSRVASFGTTTLTSGWRVSYDDANKQVLLLGATPGLIIRVQ